MAVHTSIDLVSLPWQGSIIASIQMNHMAESRWIWTPIGLIAQTSVFKTGILPDSISFLFGRCGTIWTLIFRFGDENSTIKLNTYGSLGRFRTYKTFYLTGSCSTNWATRLRSKYIALNDILEGFSSKPYTLSFYMLYHAVILNRNLINLTYWGLLGNIIPTIFYRWFFNMKEF